MTRADVLSRLEVLETRLRTQGVAHLYLYGSFARDEARADSDVDVLADFADDVALDLSRFMDARATLEEAIPGRDIGFSTRESLVPLYRPPIEATIVAVF